jgi:hypothetical protein
MVSGLVGGGHYEIAADESAGRRLMVAFVELAKAI